MDAVLIFVADLTLSLFQLVGLVDTAVKTAETGYMARRLMKVSLKTVYVCIYLTGGV